jgi:hypothetical protein
LAKKSFYVENNRLYFIKDNKTERLENWNFKDIEKVILKKILIIKKIAYFKWKTWEIWPYIIQIFI